MFIAVWAQDFSAKVHQAYRNQPIFSKDRTSQSMLSPISSRQCSWFSSFRFCLLAVSLVMGVDSANALSLGRLRGVALLGQPMDLTIQVQTDAGENPSALCFEAEIFHGDVRQESSRVRVTPAGEMISGGLPVRIQSAALVDEPVVTVYLRETCAAKVSRRFVLLSEIPPDALAPTVPLVIAQPSASPATTSASPVQSGTREVQVPRVESRPVEPAVPAQSVQLPPAKPRPPVVKASSKEPGEKKTTTETTKPAVVAQPSKKPSPKPSLKLDPVDTLRERVMQLEAAAEQAAKSAPTEDDQRLKKMEQELQSLLSVSKKNERNLAELRDRLRQAESEKYDNPLVYALLACLLVALASLALLWLRQRKSDALKQWWHASNPASASQSVQEDKVPTAAREKVFPTPRRPAVMADAGASTATAAAATLAAATVAAGGAASAAPTPPSASQSRKEADMTISQDSLKPDEQALKPSADEFVLPDVDLEDLLDGRTDNGRGGRPDKGRDERTNGVRDDRRGAPVNPLGKLENDDSPVLVDLDFIEMPQGTDRADQATRQDELSADTQPDAALQFPDPKTSAPELAAAASGDQEAPILIDFPPAGEVNIDISHLSLTPTDESLQDNSSVQNSTPQAPMLDFELPGLEKKSPDKKD